ncbi:glutathione S-transferase [Alsobacter metallidurans]|uniref:Glutathione S-transferase n=1 Tax=Alsobacter metallidurans TaxID=340221 RepID=A0A917I8K6_9HYPH|nr:glutathione S-transferase family protein [Alsobacter metallidurans]GGH24829.1 glutathione S-transferase [Alsobacter metallidurans]
MTARYTLHGIFLSGPTYKVGLALALAGEPFDYTHVNLRAGEHKTPEFMAMNRFGQVPCLTDNSNGRNLCQSASILEYIADKTGKLGGATLDERVAAREWMFWVWDKLAAPIYRVRGAKAGFRTLDDATVAMYVGEAGAALKFLDNALAGRSWLVGEGPTIADIDVYGVVHYAGDAGVDLAPYPNVVAWVERFRALPGFAEPAALLPAESKAA